MPQSLAKILIHLIYSTKNREPFLIEGLRDELHRYTATILKELDSPALLMNSVEDHVHILFSLSRTQQVSHLVQEAKTGTSKWLKTKAPNLARFQWQNGYGAFSVSQSNLDDGLNYIAKQPEHHRKKTFQDEYREFCRRY